MRLAYVDTSCLLAIALAEDRAAQVLRSLQTYDVLLSSNLLEAELRATLEREKVADDPEIFLGAISWIYPDRPLTSEIATVLNTGYVKGADLWHLAVALFFSPLHQIAFLTLDARQHEVSVQLGFGHL